MNPSSTDRTPAGLTRERVEEWVDFEVSEEFLRDLNASARARSFQPGDIVFHFAHDNTHIHLVTSGVLMRHQMHSSGKMQVLTKFLGFKNLLGLDMLYAPGSDGHIKVVDTAVTAVTTLAVPLAVFDGFVTRHPAVARGMVHYFSRENAITTMQFIIRKRKGNASYLARVVLQLLGLYRASLPEGDRFLITGLTRNDLADFTGMSRQMVSGILGRFEVSGILKREVKSLRVTNLKGLVVIATSEEPRSDQAQDPSPQSYQITLPAWSEPLG